MDTLRCAIIKKTALVLFLGDGGQICTVETKLTPACTSFHSLNDELLLNTHPVLNIHKGLRMSNPTTRAFLTVKAPI